MDQIDRENARDIEAIDYDSFRRYFPSIVNEVLHSLCKLQELNTEYIPDIVSELTKVIDQHEKRLHYELKYIPEQLELMNNKIDILYYLAHDLAKEIIRVAVTENREKLAPLRTDLAVAMRIAWADSWGDE